MLFLFLMVFLLLLPEDFVSALEPEPKPGIEPVEECVLSLLGKSTASTITTSLAAPKH